MGTGSHDTVMARALPGVTGPRVGQAVAPGGPTPRFDLLACTTWQTALTCLVSPVVMTLLLTVGSGKRLLEKRVADRPGFAAYAARTSGFIPRPPRRKSSRHRR